MSTGTTVTNTNVLTEDEYQTLRARMDKLNAWVDTQRGKRKCRACKGTGQRALSWMQVADHPTGEPDIECPKCDGLGYVPGWASYRIEDMPADVVNVSNEETSKVEVYEFLRDRPRKYTAYVQSRCLHGLAPEKVCGHCVESFSAARYGERKVYPAFVTTFMGAILGRITWYGPVYRVTGFGGQTSERQNLRVLGVNGVVYSATYYKSSGDYCRMKAFKDKNNEVSK